MADITDAHDRHLLTTCIVGHSYITVLSTPRAPVEIAEAALEAAGDIKKPFVVVSCHRLAPRTFADYVALEIADIVLE